MNCPSCGAPMHLEADKEFLRCNFCKNIFFPEKNDDGVRVLPKLSELACPVCEVPLVHAALEGWRMLYCSKCRGMLVSMDVFVELILDLHSHSDGSGAIPPPPDPKELLRHTNCPKCHQQMNTHYYAGPGNVIIDDCETCHLNWLDYGELRRIVKARDETLYKDAP